MPKKVIDIHNLPELLEKRRYLRRHLTKSEAILWSCLKDSRLDGRKFRRQHSVGPYILDFYCPAERLAIELDGSVHLEPLQADYDKKRDHYLRSNGIKILRFGNDWVLKEPQYVLETIAKEFGWSKRRENDAQ